MHKPNLYKLHSSRSKKLNIQKLLKNLVLPLAILLPVAVNAAVIGPKLDINGNGLTNTEGNDGVFLSSTKFNVINAVAGTILRDAADGGNIDIADELFNLTSTGTYDSTNGGLFSGTFTIGGLLSGSFTNLAVSAPATIFGITSSSFGGDLFYTGGSLAGSLTTGRIEGTFNGDNLKAKVGAVSVVPVPAAVWLFGSGLLGLVGVARRKA